VIGWGNLDVRVVPNPIACPPLPVGTDSTYSEIAEEGGSPKLVADALPLSTPMPPSTTRRMRMRKGIS
jgi:hypothetical protein